MLTRTEMKLLVESAINSRNSVQDEIDFQVLYEKKFKQLNPHFTLNAQVYYPEINIEDSANILTNIQKRCFATQYDDRKKVAATEIANSLQTINPLLYCPKSLLERLQQELFKLNKYIYSYQDQHKVAGLKKDYRRIVSMFNERGVDKNDVLNKLNKMRKKYQKTTLEVIQDFFNRLITAAGQLLKSENNAKSDNTQNQLLFDQRVCASVSMEQKGFRYHVGLFNESMRRNNMPDVVDCAQKVAIKR